MKLGDMVMVVENHKGTETNFLLELTDYMGESKCAARLVTIYASHQTRPLQLRSVCATRTALNY